MKPYILGVDVGGSRIRAGVVAEDGSIVGRYHTNTHSEREPDVVVGGIEDACRTVLDQSGVRWSDVRGIGVGFGGTVNGPEGVVLISSNLPAWDHFPLRDRLSQKLGVPVLMDNDTNLGALGEYTFGAGRGTQRLCYVTLSTGFGLGIIENGRVLRGTTGTAGEIAHAPVDVNGPPCTCGKRGCLMSYASGIGLSRMAWDAIDSGEPTELRAVAGTKRRRIRGEDIVRIAREGDLVARRIIEKAGYYVGVGFSLIVQILNPERIIVGGGLTHMDELLWEPAMRGYRENTQPEIIDSAKLEPWSLGEDVTVLGAVALVLHNTPNM